MHKKYISIVMMLVGAGMAVGCANIALAEEAGMPPPPSGSGSYSGGTMPPPPSQPMPPPPSGGGEPYQMPPPPGSQPGMMPPPPQGESREGMRYPSPEDTKRMYEERYNQEFQKQYNAEFERRSGGMQPKGEPFREGGMRPEGQPFRGEGGMRPPGQPFSADRGGFGGGDHQGPQGSFGQSWGGNGSGEEGFEGPSDEDRTKMMEEQEKQMKEQQLKQMKRGFGGMESGLKQMSKMIDRLKKKGVAVPEEYVSLVNDLNKALQTLKGATEFDETVEAAMDIISEKGSDLGEIGPKLGMLEQWPRTIGQAEKEIKKLNNAFAKAKKKKGASEYAGVVAKVEEKVSEISSRFAEIKAAGERGDFEEAMGEIQEFFESVGDTHREIGILEQISNISKMIKQGEKEISQFEKQVKKLEKKGKDVSLITASIAEGRAKIAELKDLAKNTEAEPEDFFEVVEELDAIREKAIDAYNELSGKSNSLEGAIIRALFPLWGKR